MVTGEVPPMVKVPPAVNRMYACAVVAFMTTPAAPVWVSMYVPSRTPFEQGAQVDRVCVVPASHAQAQVVSPGRAAAV